MCGSGRPATSTALQSNSRQARRRRRARSPARCCTTAGGGRSRRSSRCARHGRRRAAPGSRMAAASWLVTSATMNRTMTVTMSVGAVDAEGVDRRGEEEIVGERGRDRRPAAPGRGPQNAAAASTAGKIDHVDRRGAPARRDPQADAGSRARPARARRHKPGRARDRRRAGALTRAWSCHAAKCARASLRVERPDARFTRLPHGGAPKIHIESLCRPAPTSRAMATHRRNCRGCRGPSRGAPRPQRSAAQADARARSASSTAISAPRRSTR